MSLSYYLSSYVSAERQRHRLTESAIISVRFKQSCKTVRPVGRAGHGSAFDWDRQIIWIFGGFTSYYPYLRTDGSGSGACLCLRCVGIGTAGLPDYHRVALAKYHSP